ncbi:MAG: hypothetical protein ACI81L_002803 [Verrucomicrobiales bacterium]|jgi:hypothetical protein
MPNIDLAAPIALACANISVILFGCIAGLGPASGPTTSMVNASTILVSCVAKRRLGVADLCEHTDSLDLTF